MKHTIYKSRDFLRPSQVVAKRWRRKITRSILSLMGTLIIIVLFVFTMRMDFLKIQGIEIKGNVSIKTEELKFSIGDIISGNYLFFMPKDNILIFPKDKILKELANKFPRIETLQVSINKSTLNIMMTERKPHALWCGISSAQSIDPCFFVDSQGFVFSQAPQFDGSSYLKLYGATPDTPTTEAWQFISEKEYSDVQNFIDNLKNIGIEISALDLSDANTYKFRMKNNGLLLASRNIPLTETLENLKAGLSNDVFWNKKKTVLVAVEYLDMRYGNKIFYKLIGR